MSHFLTLPSSVFWGCSSLFANLAFLTLQNQPVNQTTRPGLAVVVVLVTIIAEWLGLKFDHSRPACPYSRQNFLLNIFFVKSKGSRVFLF